LNLAGGIEVAGPDADHSGFPVTGGATLLHAYLRDAEWRRKMPERGFRGVMSTAALPEMFSAASRRAQTLLDHRCAVSG